MENGLLTLDFGNIKGAIISTIIVGLGATLLYVYKVGSVFNLDWQVVIDTFVMAGVGSLVKNFFTDNEGKFMGKIQL